MKWYDWETFEILKIVTTHRELDAELYLVHVGNPTCRQNSIPVVYVGNSVRLARLPVNSSHGHVVTRSTRHHSPVHLGEPVPEENFWTLRCKGRPTAADTLTIRLGATPFGPTRGQRGMTTYHIGPHRTTWDHIGAHRTTSDHVGPHLATSDHMALHGTTTPDFKK